MSHISRVLDIQQPSFIEGRSDRSVNWHRLFFFPCRETRVKDGLVARRTPLGWVIFGANSDDALPEGEQVPHVCLAEPVDTTEFWKTESMGVSVSPCTCEATKMPSEERAKLKSKEDSCELEGNKWIMKYQWKKDPSSVPNNYAQVLKKLESNDF